MSQIPLKIEINCNAKPFRKDMRKVVLSILSSFYGRRRFFISDYWRVLFSLPIRKVYNGTVQNR